MKYRKQILSAILGFMVLLVLGDWLQKNLLRGPLETRRAKADRLQTAIDQKRKDLDGIRRDGKQLAAWWSQSLPEQVEVARSLYQAWLLELVMHVGLDGPHIDPGDPISRPGVYQVLPFTVRGQGTLRQLTKFLFEFDSANHLHQIRALGITPIPKSDLLSLSISVEAMVLPGNGRRDRLATGRSERLASDRLDDYQVIVDRDLFALGGSPDVLEYAVLTGVTSVDDHPKATFTVQTTNEKSVVGVGDRLEIGSFRAKVLQIDGSDVILQSDGQRWLLTLGDRLIDAFALPPEW